MWRGCAGSMVPPACSCCSGAPSWRACGGHDAFFNFAARAVDWARSEPQGRPRRAHGRGRICSGLSVRRGETAMKRVGFTSGSFDPVTNGHRDVIERAARLVDTLVVGVGVHPGKTPLFSVAEKIDLLKTETAPIAKATGTKIEIVTFDNLTVEAAAAAGASVIFRGLRDANDFDYEMQMAGMNGSMAPTIQTVFLPASPQVRHITGTLVRQIALMGGDVSKFASPGVARKLKAKARARQEIVKG